MGRLLSKSDGATSRRIRRQLRRALPTTLIDDFDDNFDINDFDIDLVPSSPPSASPTTTATVDRYNFHDLILSFILFNMLICHASMIYILDVVHLFYMIYILVLVWKFPNYLTWLADRLSGGACFLHFRLFVVLVEKILRVQPDVKTGCQEALPPYSSRRCRVCEAEGRD
jgi:hypothetical protein